MSLEKERGTWSSENKLFDYFSNCLRFSYSKVWIEKSWVEKVLNYELKQLNSLMMNFKVGLITLLGFITLFAVRGTFSLDCVLSTEKVLKINGTETPCNCTERYNVTCINTFCGQWKFRSESLKLYVAPQQQICH